MENSPEKVLEFWFGDIEDLNQVTEARIYKWFLRDGNFDEQVKLNFESELQKALEGQYDHWKNTPKGTLALIIMLDQFPRNTYREDPRAYAFDQKALETCLEAIEKKFDLELLPVERLFVYLPMEHSEEIAMQDKMLEKSMEIKEGIPDNPTLLKNVELWIDFAYKHKVVIEKFGRFPHRNAALGRETTEAEKKWLEEYPRGF